LLDTGARAQEFLNINLEEFNHTTGEIFIRRGKGGKPRTVYLGRKSRKAVRGYFKFRTDGSNSLWVTIHGERLTYGGLRSIVRRRAKLAEVEVPALHDFRRAFALNMLRAGVDIFSIQKLLGHADISMLRRYLDQTTDDIAAAHRIGSPVDLGRF
jgi:site-specific recombinase XerD